MIVKLIKEEVWDDGRVYVEFSDQHGYIFSSIADYEDEIARIENDIDLAKKICCGYSKKNGKESVLNKDFVVDLFNSNSVSVKTQ